LQINALLFVPGSNPEKLGLHRAEPAVALYCRKILIDPSPADLLPEWLRFLKGVVDSEDLPLNISRETMQDKALLEKIGKVLTKRFLRLLEDEAKKSPERYAKFYKEFGIFLKEGAALDFAHREQLLGLLRFETSLTEKGRTTSLADIVGRMADDQSDLYYLLGPSREAIEAGPYLEGLRARNLEVIFCCEPVDEYVMHNVREFQGKKFTAADRAGLSLKEAAVPEGADRLQGEELDGLLAWLGETLGERVTGVKASQRLVGSPAVALLDDPLMSPQLRRMMKAMNPDAAEPPLKVQLEINPAHGLIRHLAGLRAQDPATAASLAEQLLDTSLLGAGLLEEPSRMVQRLYDLLARVSPAAAPAQS
jgi:molecular chaperone HtpG